jgi:hypothetical protein
MEGRVKDAPSGVRDQGIVAGSEPFTLRGK